MHNLRQQGGQTGFKSQN